MSRVAELVRVTDVVSLLTPEISFHSVGRPANYCVRASDLIPRRRLCDIESREKQLCESMRRHRQRHLSHAWISNKKRARASMGKIVI